MIDGFSKAGQRSRRGGLWGPAGGRHRHSPPAGARLTGLALECRWCGREKSARRRCGGDVCWREAVRRRPENRLQNRGRVDVVGLSRSRAKRAAQPTLEGLCRPRYFSSSLRQGGAPLDRPCSATQYPAPSADVPRSIATRRRRGPTGRACSRRLEAHGDAASRALGCRDGSRALALRGGYPDVAGAGGGQSGHGRGR